MDERAVLIVIIFFLAAVISIVALVSWEIGKYLEDICPYDKDDGKRWEDE